MPGALNGVRVIDFGQYIAGPLLGMMLADHGADVIRVDPPGGPMWDTPANATWNRGKRRIALDLKRPADLEIARRLLRTADVAIENFRPGVMDRLGLGADHVREANPRLIYCSLPGFASDDPRAAMPAWEGVVAAATGTYREDRGVDGAPLFTAIPIASTFAAFIGAVSVLSALYSREHDGHGQRIEVPLFDAMFTAIGANGLSVKNSKASGGRPNDFGGGIFQCADGRWVQLALAKPGFQVRFARAAGVGDRVNIEALATNREERDRLAEMLPDLLRTRTADDWESLGAEADVPLIKVRSAEEWIATEHARASASIVEVRDPEIGWTWQPNSPVRLSASDPQERRPASEDDADRASILAELDGAEAHEPHGDGMPPRTAALEGVRVIDLSQVLAGPTGGRTLAEFGADVIKINPPDEEGAGIRFSVHRYHTDVNRGKRTMLLNLKTEEGVHLFWRLLANADLVIHNFRPGVLERLGIGYEQAREHKPDIVYTSVTAYGEGGPWGIRPGYEPFGQAPTGMAARQGGSGKPASQPFAVNDYGTGLMSAFASLLALFERKRTGRGQRAEAALAYTGTILQSPYLIGYEGKTWGEPAGPEARGWSPLQRLYRASDGWFFLGAGVSQLADLARIHGLDGVDALSEAALAEELERRFASDNVEAWCEQLVAAGIGAHGITRIDELMRDPWVIEHGISITRVHDTGEEVTLVGPPARLSGTPVTPGNPVATPGRDAASILDTAGLADRLEGLVAAGAVVLEMAAVE